MIRDLIQSVNGNLDLPEAMYRKPVDEPRPQFQTRPDLRYPAASRQKSRANQALHILNHVALTIFMSPRTSTTSQWDRKHEEPAAYFIGRKGGGGLRKGPPRELPRPRVLGEDLGEGGRRG
jgi:hypothetical protein